MTRRYHEDVIDFLYPENWEVIEETGSAALVDVTLQSPESGIWTLQAYPDYPGGTSLCASVIDSLKQEYEDLEATPISREFGGQEAFGFELAFFCLDFLISGRVFELSVGNRQVVILYQAELRDFQKVEPVFEAVTTSLCRQAAAD